MTKYRHIKQIQLQKSRKKIKYVKLRQFGGKIIFGIFESGIMDNLLPAHLELREFTGW